MPTLGTSGLGESLRKTTTFVVGTWEQSLSLLPINSPVSTKLPLRTETSTESCWARERWRSLWRPRLCPGVTVTRSREMEISFHIGTTWHQATHLSLQALNWKAGHQPGHLPEEQQTYNVCEHTLWRTLSLTYMKAFIMTWKRKYRTHRAKNKSS